jgi:predicted CopG family antitoxin
MATKTLTITEDAYERLKAHKRGDESFSDVVNRLSKSRDNPKKARGLWDDIDAGQDHEERHQQLGEEIDEHYDEVFGQ